MNDRIKSIKDAIGRNRGVQKIRQTWDENPLAVIGVAVATLSATARIISAVNSMRSRRIWAREVDRRVRKGKRS